jgi:hypothetical protein
MYALTDIVAVPAWHSLVLYFEKQADTSHTIKILNVHSAPPRSTDVALNDAYRMLPRGRKRRMSARKRRWVVLCMHVTNIKHRTRIGVNTSVCIWEA